MTPQMIEWHMKDLNNRMYCNLEEGKKISMPRYYKDKIYSEQQRKQIAFFAKIKAKGDDLHDFINDVGKHLPVRSQRDIAAFERMHSQASQRDKL